MRYSVLIRALKATSFTLVFVTLSGCAWVNAAGRVYQGIGDGLTTASNETKPGFSKKLFGIGGKVGKAVGGILVDASGNDSKNNSVSLNAAERQQVVQSVQTQLNRLGYDAGPNDGRMGARTSTAIKHYQKDNGLTVSGNITKSPVQKLGLRE